MKSVLVFCVLILFSGCKKGVNPQNNASEQREWLTYLNDYSITAIAEEGNYMWTGTYKSGVIKIEKSSGNSIFYTIENSNIPSNYIEAIAIEDNGTKWIGTRNGLVKISENTWAVFSQSNSDLPSSFIKAIAIDMYGIKWIGCATGLARYDNTLWTIFNKNNSDIPSNEILSLAVDQQNNVWIGTAASPFDPTGRNPIGGLAKFDGTNWLLYNTFNSDINQNWINALCVDKNNQVWIGTGMSLNLYNGDKIIRFNSSNSCIPFGPISALATDSMDKIWIGFLDYGCVEFDGTNCRVFDTTNSPLPDNYVRSIFVDNKDNKWLGTSKGLAIFNKNGIKF